jgi:hypothetical protein
MVRSYLRARRDFSLGVPEPNTKSPAEEGLLNALPNFSILLGCWTQSISKPPVIKLLTPGFCS